MTERLAYRKHAAGGMKAIHGIVTYLDDCGLSPTLIELVNLRVSQINGCAFCLDMHAHALAKMGADARTLATVAGWREARRFFSPRECAALAWAESVNAVPQRTPSDEEWRELREHFSEGEIAELTFAVGAIRAWNMLNASFRTPVPEVPYAGE
jgi:AhpD family alkylhydroperoxidase